MSITGADLAHMGAIDHPKVRRDTAAHKLTMLSLGAVLDLFICHLILRRDIDPDALERASERMNDIATDARRAKMREPKQ